MPEGPGDSIGGVGGCVPLERLHVIVGGGSASEIEVKHMESCAACRESLSHVREDDRFAGELAQAVIDLRAAALPALVPVIDGYEVRGELHRGAQGVVYEAYQESTRRLVAIKVPAVGGMLTMRQLARFEREVELAASIAHPAVVAVHASGLTKDSRPYIAMELVSGLPLDEHVRALKESDPKWLRKTLRLFAEISRGVDAAHQRGIIHRDLKPANILVDDEGRPRILDFGVARLHEGQGQTVTREGDFVGTLAYAAPEQFSAGGGQVDTRTDVYALGVIAYELVTGERPHAEDQSVAGLVRAITEQAVPAPRIGGKLVDRELATVLNAALNREASRRYGSAGALAEDVERYLQGRPLRAKKDKISYSLRLALKRHPFIAGATAGVAVLAMIASVALVRSELRARRADQTRAATGDAILTVLSRTNQDANSSHDPVQSVDEFIDQAVKITRERLAKYPREQSDFLVRLAVAYAGRRELPKAQALLEEAIAIRGRVVPLGHPDIARIRVELGDVLRKREDRPGAKRELTAAMEVLRKAFGESDIETLKCMQALADLQVRDREYAAAQGLLERVVAGRLKLPASKDNELQLCESRVTLAAALRGQCLYEEAVKLCTMVLKTLDDVHGAGSRQAGEALQHLVANLNSLERYRDAEPLAEEAERIGRKWYKANDVQYVAALTQLASVRRRLGGDGRTEEQRRKLQEARELGREILRVRLEVYGERDHELVAESRSLLGQTLTKLGELAEAEELLRQALETRRRLRSGADERNIARTESYLGECLAAAGKGGEAEPLLRHGFDVLRAVKGCQGTRDISEAAGRLMEFLERAGRTEEAAAVRWSLQSAGVAGK